MFCYIWNYLALVEDKYVWRWAFFNCTWKHSRQVKSWKYAGDVSVLKNAAQWACLKQ